MLPDDAVKQRVAKREVRYYHLQELRPAQSGRRRLVIISDASWQMYNPLTGLWSLATISPPCPPGSALCAGDDCLFAVVRYKPENPGSVSKFCLSTGCGWKDMAILHHHRLDSLMAPSPYNLTSHVYHDGCVYATSGSRVLLLHVTTGSWKEPTLLFVLPIDAIICVVNDQLFVIGGHTPYTMVPSVCVEQHVETQWVTAPIC